MSENTNPEIHTEVWRPSKNPWLIVIPPMISILMFIIDETISNVALPYMAGSFSVSRNESTWILTSYLIASGLIIPSVDFLSKRFGRINYFMFCVILFTISSMLCGCAWSLGSMVLFRFMQGIGGGALLPLTQSIMLEAFPKKDRAMAMALFGFVVVIGPILGPVMGGWITENWSWPYIYLINIPIGIITLFLAKELLEESPYGKKVEGIKPDYFGIMFLIFWVCSLQVVLDKGNDADWFGSPWVCWATAFSVVAGICFFVSQLKNKENPLVDLRVLWDRNFFFGTAIQVVMMGILLASSTILPSMLQTLLGYNSFLSGVSMIPRGAGCFAGMIISALLINKISERAQVMTGLLIVGFGGLLFGNINLQIALKNIAIPNFLFGMGMSLSMVPIVNLSMITLKNSQLTNATGLQNMVKNIGGAVGTSLVSTMISRFSQVHQMMMVGSLRETNNVFMERLAAYTSKFISYTVEPSTASYMSQGLMYKQLQLQAVLWAYIDSFRIFAIACFILIPFLWLLKSVKSLTAQGLVVDE